MDKHSKERHPSSLGPKDPTDEDTVLNLVEQASRPHRSLATLYRMGRERGLIKKHTQYT